MANSSTSDAPAPAPKVVRCELMTPGGLGRHWRGWHLKDHACRDPRFQVVPTPAPVADFLTPEVSVSRTPPAPEAEPCPMHGRTDLHEPDEPAPAPPTCNPDLQVQPPEVVDVLKALVVADGRVRKRLLAVARAAWFAANCPGLEK
jgi:hypothetical protein